MSHLDAYLGPEVVAAIEQLVDERVVRALAEHQAPTPLPPWLTVAQTADLLGCPQAAVRMRIKRGRLEARHHGRRLYVASASVVQLR